MKQLRKILLKVQVTLTALVLLPSLGQAAGNGWLIPAQEMLIWALLAVEVFLLLITITLFVVIKTVANKILRPVTEQQLQEVTEEVPEKSIWQRLLTKMNDAVPVEREEEVMTAHSYDGIYELDNNLPPWWKALFYATIVFSVIYLVHYHILDTGDLQEEEYEKEMAEAKAAVEAHRTAHANSIDENTVAFVEDAERLENGKTLFVQKCAPCHGQAGEGGVGPNLTDQYWLHGGSIQDIFRVITYGVPEKGMIPWKAQLSPTQIQDISSFIITLEGTNPPNAKEPQGELYEREASVALKD